jgi:hypothetical protein
MPEEGALIRTRNDSRIYAVGPNNRLRLIPDLPTLTAIDGRTLKDVRYVTEAELEGYELDEPMPSRVELPTLDDGTVLPDQRGNLFLLRDGTRRLVPDAATALVELDPERIVVLSQAEIDAIPLGSPIATTQQVTAGLVSDLGSGHVIATGATLLGDGHLHCVTRTEARAWFMGWTGGVQVVLNNASGVMWHAGELHSFGIDAPPIGSGTRTDVWDEWFDTSVTQQVAGIAIGHAWTPKVQLGGIIRNMTGAMLNDVIVAVFQAGGVLGGMNQSPNQPGL